MSLKSIHNHKNEANRIFERFHRKRANEGIGQFDFGLQGFQLGLNFLSEKEEE
jgi:hypothetical protein